MHAVGHFLSSGLRESAVMVWMTFWPLVLGFSISGVVQSFVARDGLRATLGRDSLTSVARASVLGMISSSCSYAASAMARALFARGASFTNATIFMVASTNLVIELGIVLYLLLGWQFLVAELVGGVIMVTLLAIVGNRLLNRDQETLREQVRHDTPTDDDASSASTMRRRDGWFRAARYCVADLTMLRKELFFGFLVAGFLAAEVPNTWWSHIFLRGHGAVTVIENVILSPLIAVISFVCSVGNIPLASALWVKGVSFGGVVAFVFADLVTLPLLLIYRRFYGSRKMWQLFGVLWVAMSVGGLATELLFRAFHAVPSRTMSTVMHQGFDLGWTLGLNAVAFVVLAMSIFAARKVPVDESVAIDPVCGMQVQKATPAAVADHGGARYYFCAPRCQERFVANPQRFLGEVPAMREDRDGDAIDPICGMRVNSRDPAAQANGPDGPVYFCSEGCKGRWLAGPDVAPGTQVVSLSRKNPT